MDVHDLRGDVSVMSWRKSRWAARFQMVLHAREIEPPEPMAWLSISKRTTLVAEGFEELAFGGENLVLAARLLVMVMH